MSKTKLLAFVAVFTIFGVFAQTCQAGPLLDWLRGRPVVQRYNAYRYGAPLQHQAYYQGPAANMQAAGACTTTCPKTRYQTVNRVVANYVPYTAFRTEWYRVPVTHYRPVTSSNPQTGCVSTCMKPCTTYQMQARRVPYTTYQTVYRTVQHRVPYTVYETSYGNAGCSSCGTCTSCGTGAPQGIVQNQVPYGLNTGGGYNVPANTIPQLNPSEIQPDTTLQKPPVETPQPQADPNANGGSGEKTQNSSHVRPNLNIPENPAPVVDDSNRTASLIRGKWNYSPVRNAGYMTSASNQNATTRGNFSGFSSAGNKPSGQPFRSSGWKSVNK